MKTDHFERISISLRPPPGIVDELTAIYEDIKGCRWAKPENLHLSLRTVGEVDEPLRDAIASELSKIAVEEFILEIEGLGIFPNRGQPQVIYAGVGSAHPRLFQLHHRVEQAIASLGLPLELKTFYPHITLARTSRASFNSVREFIKRHRNFTAASFKVDSFELCRAQYTHQGALYQPLQQFGLLNQSRHSTGDAV